MKDYKLSEIRKICLNQVTCEGCACGKFCKKMSLDPPQRWELSPEIMIYTPSDSLVKRYDTLLKEYKELSERFKTLSEKYNVSQLALAEKREILERKNAEIIRLSLLANMPKEKPAVETVALPFAAGDPVFIVWNDKIYEGTIDAINIEVVRGEKPIFDFYARITTKDKLHFVSKDIGTIAFHYHDAAERRLKELSK